MDKEVHKREERFHDDWASFVDPASVNVDALETACTSPETRYIIDTIGKDNLFGKKILEVGCGFGEASVFFAKQGANVTATDISMGMVDLALKVAEHHNVKIQGQACSADALPFEDSSFDIIYAANVLHHVNLETTLKELKRVLKPDGLFISWDPIKYNPAIKIYRKMADDVRTVDEHPIDMAHLKTIRKNFRIIKNRGFWLLTNIIFVKYYFINKLDPSKVRYWKYVIDDADNVAGLYKPLAIIDSFLLKIAPPLKWWCWNLVIIARKES